MAKLYTKIVEVCGDCCECNWNICYKLGIKVDVNKIPPEECPLEDF